MTFDSETTNLLPTTRTSSTTAGGDPRWNLKVVALTEAPILGILAVCLVYKGERSNHDDTLACHPFLMTLTCFGMTLAMISQRAMPLSWPARLVQITHGLLFTLSIARAIYAVIIKRRKADTLGLHGIIGYVVLGLLAVQYLLGGRAISLTSRVRGHAQPQHALVRLHVITGHFLYGAFSLALCLALFHGGQLRIAAAVLILASNICILYGLQ